MSVKRGSVPWAVQLPLTETLYVGLDVSHERRKNSVAAIIS